MKKVAASLVFGGLCISSSDVFAESALKSVNGIRSMIEAKVTNLEKVRAHSKKSQQLKTKKRRRKKESQRKAKNFGQKIGSKITAAVKIPEVQLALGTSAAIVGGILAYRYLGVKKNPIMDSSIVKISTKDFLTKAAEFARSPMGVGIAAVGTVLSSVLLMKHHSANLDDTSTQDGNSNPGKPNSVSNTSSMVNNSNQGNSNNNQGTNLNNRISNPSSSGNATTGNVSNPSSSENATIGDANQEQIEGNSNSEGKPKGNAPIESDSSLDSAPQKHTDIYEDWSKSNDEDWFKSNSTNSDAYRINIGPDFQQILNQINSLSESAMIKNDTNSRNMSREENAAIREQIQNILYKMDPDTLKDKETLSKNPEILKIKDKYKVTQDQDGPSCLVTLGWLLNKTRENSKVKLMLVNRLLSLKRLVGC